MEKFVLAVLVIGFALVVSLLLTLPTMLLWNWLIPAEFGGPELGFWQVFGLMVLVELLFKNSAKSSK